MSREMLSEIELLEASAKGDTTAFEVVVKKYQSLICAITFSATGDVERSEELAQETFISAWKDLRQLEDPGKFRSWLGSIARNVIKNFFRRQKREATSKATLIHQMEDGEPSGSGPVQTAITKEQQAVVRDALKQIPEAYRVPLVLFYRQQQSVKEVAQQLELSEDVVRQRLFRGRKFLKERVAAMVEDTISRTEPGSTFATAVIASIAGILAKGSGVAATAAVAAAASATGTTAVIKTVTSGVTAKIVAAAAVVAIGVGAVAVYKQLTGSTGKSGSTELPDVPQQIQTVQSDRMRTEADTVPQATATANESSADGAKAGPESGLMPTPEEPTQAKVAGYQFKPKGVLSGAITDIETGEAVIDATVRISVGRIYETRTDGNGFYFFGSIEKDGNYDIAIDSKEYIGIAVGQRQPIVSLARDKQTVKHFQLAWACQVDLRVVDEDRAGIKGAKVVATSLAYKEPKVVSYFGDIRQTDAKGHILLGGFRPAETEYLITVWHETKSRVMKPDGQIWSESNYDYAQARRVVKLTNPQVVEQIEIVLKKGTEVKGYAEYSDGVPAGDLEIVARPAWWHCNYSIHGYEIGDEGGFSLKHITPGTYDICAYFPRGESGGGTTKTVMQVQLPPTGNDLLVVRIPDKSPQSLASIAGTLIYLGEEKPRYVHVDAYSATAGHAHTTVGYNSDNEVKDYFVLSRLEPGKYRLTFSGENLEEKVIENVQAPGEGLEVVLQYLTKPKFSGTVVDSKTGEPVKNFRMRVRKLRTLRGPNYGQDDQWAYSSDEEGRFNIDVVGPGIYQLQAAADGYAPAWSTQVSTDEPANVLLKLGSGGGITGTVVTEDGEQITAAKVMPLSRAGGSMPRTLDVFISEEGAVETIGGQFTLEHLAAGTETLKVVHPMYAFSISDGIEVVDGQTTEGITIVLRKGATVEGYVYDADGEPEVGVALYVQDADNYGGSADEQEGRLGTATTDSNGFYRISGLPEKMCSVRREKEWQSLGVVRRTLIPKSGEVSRLDLGGTPIVTGTVVVDGEPLTNKRILLAPADLPQSGLFECYARTDTEGGFAFTGAIEGPHAIYYKNPDKRSQWTKIVDIDVASADLSLGIITPADVSKLLVTIDERQLDTKLAIKQIYISKAGKVFGIPVAVADPPRTETEPWTINGVEPGKYVLNLTRNDQVQMRNEIELAPGQSQWEVTMEVPESTASVSGKIVGNTPSRLAFWREGVDVFGVITTGRQGVYKIENLPGGTYFIGSSFSLLNSISTLAEFELLPGQNEIVDLDLSGHVEPKMAYLIAQVVDDHNQFRGDVKVWLQGDSAPIETWQSTMQGHIFLTVPGKYVLHVAAQGYKKVEKSVALNATEPGVGRPKTMLVHLEKD